MSTALSLKILIAALGLGTVLILFHTMGQQDPPTPPPVTNSLDNYQNYQMTEHQKAVNRSMQTVVVRPDAQMK